MSQGGEVVGLYVRDQDEALAFYVEKLGFRMHADMRHLSSVQQQPDRIRKYFEHAPVRYAA